jgi:hypothetical protein
VDVELHARAEGPRETSRHELVVAGDRDARPFARHARAHRIGPIAERRKRTECD